jgi:hypothetical protein
MPDVNGKPTTEELRAALFVQPETLEDLHRWIKVYLGIDLPIIKVDPESNSSPMELVWELYDAARLNKPGYSEVLAYAARDSFKTFSAAIFEVLCILLLERSVAHMAAIEPQAKKSQQYFKKHVTRPFIKDYVTSKNERTVEITRYYCEETGENLTRAQYEVLLPGDQLKYREIKNYVVIVICTIQGANSEHVPVMVVDEVDVVENPDAYQEAKMIPAPINGMMPITLYTSTRKYSWGLVQKEIDNAAKSNLVIRHWNLIDVTHHCPPSRHQPELPKINIAVNDELLTAISEADYHLLDSAERAKYTLSEGYQGCLTNCRLFAACKGRLAALPPCKKCGDRGLGCTGFPKPVEHTLNTFNKVTLEKAKAQLLCRKPSSEGLIYPNFSRELHMKTANQMAGIILGEMPKIQYDKSMLIELLKERGARFVSGLDHGFSHNFVVVTGAIYGSRLFIFDVLSQSELELPQKITLCRERILPWNPEVWADTENPGDNKTLKREANLRIKDWVKGKGSVVDGISLVRWLLYPAMGKVDDVRMFYLAGDEGCELLATRTTNYHWTADTAGRLTNIPDDEDDDEMDGLRYLVLNTFATKTKISVSEANLLPEQSKVPVVDGNRQYMPDTWMRQVISEASGIQYEDEEAPVSDKVGRSGAFSWSF